MPWYRVELSQTGYGTLRATVEVEAETASEAEEEAMECDIKWRVTRFSGEGYDVESVEQFTL